MDFSDYVTSNGRALERYAFVLSGDRQRAKDLVQTALLKACRHRRRVTVMEYPDAYVRRVITTSCLDWRRRSNTELLLDDRTVSATLIDESNPADQVVERDELRRALRILSLHQPAVLVLRYYEGLTTRPSPRTRLRRGHRAHPCEPGFGATARRIAHLADEPADEPADELADRLEDSR